MNIDLNLSHAPITLAELRTEEQSALSKKSFGTPICCNFHGSDFHGVMFIKGKFNKVTGTVNHAVITNSYTKNP